MSAKKPELTLVTKDNTEVLHAKSEGKHERLRRTVREFLDAIEYVPFRPVDCNQNQVFELIRSISKQAGWRNRSEE